MRACFVAAQISKQGGRSYNEDHVRSSVAQDTACWLLADGLGGHGGGAEASAIACDAAIESFSKNSEVSPEAVTFHIQAAHEAVLKQQTAQPALARMRTTIVMLVADATHAVVGHVGDSRLYQFRDGRLLSQTKDHSVPQSLVEAGEISTEEIRHHEDRNRLLRSLGEEEVVRSTVASEAIPLQRGDAFLLCSDGFWENVHELEMELDFAKSENPTQWLSHMETRLQERVDGTHDNYSAIAVVGDGLQIEDALGGKVRSQGQRTGQPAHRAELKLQWAVVLLIPLLLVEYLMFVAKPSWLMNMFHHIRLTIDSESREQKQGSAT